MPVWYSEIGDIWLERVLYIFFISFIFFHNFSPLILNKLPLSDFNENFGAGFFYDSQSYISIRNYVDIHFWHRRQRILYFSHNFEHFNIVLFWLNLRCLFLSQFSIAHFFPKIVISPHIPLQRQRALYLSPIF